MTDTATKPDPIVPEPLPDTRETEEPEGASGKPESKTPAKGEKPEEHEETRSIEQIAKDYLVPMSPEAEDAWKGREAQFVDYAREVAKGLYPTLSPQLDAGIPTRALADPYIQVANSVMGPGGIHKDPDFGKPPWSHALDGGFDPKSGRPAPMALTAWRQFVASEPSFGHDDSPAANDKAQGFISKLQTSFGAGRG